MANGRHRYRLLNLQDVCVHEDVVYVCSDFDVYHLSNAGLVSEFPIRMRTPGLTALKLFWGGVGSVFRRPARWVFARTAGTWKRLA